MYTSVQSVCFINSRGELGAATYFIRGQSLRVAFNAAAAAAAAANNRQDPAWEKSAMSSKPCFHHFHFGLQYAATPCTIDTATEKVMTYRIDWCFCNGCTMQAGKVQDS